MLRDGIGVSRLDLRRTPIPVLPPRRYNGLMADVRSHTEALLTLEYDHCARTYHPLPVVIERGEGAWVHDVDGRRYFDALSAYSALNFGHRHPQLVAAAVEQLERLTLTSRAFHNDQLGPFCQELARFCGKDLVLPMNTGAEAVESAIKVARKWGYDHRAVRRDEARIVVCDRNFHGRTTTLVSMSTDAVARGGFGPYTPGFSSVPFGDADALRAAIDEHTVAFLVEPVQGEAGVIVPPPGYLAEIRSICDAHDVLLIADEVQTGLGRTGKRFAFDHESVTPDVYILGKALGGGILPVSAIAADESILGVLGTGQHGSTFGGNPLACAVAREVIALLADGTLAEHAARLGDQAAERLSRQGLPAVTEVRQIGLWLGLDIDPVIASAREACERLLEHGVLCKDTHEQTVRVAPPLTVLPSELDWALTRIETVLGELA
jgi:ornithine--oxo-acid transaminase